ncbi:hypothetical protein DITRI_Ditri11bG0143400 [Diplodiscus trichospermus]
MELSHKKLQTLIERACALHDKLNDEIENSNGFCRFCSEHGRYCDIGQTPFEERGRLIAIRDSLKQVENTLLHFAGTDNKTAFDRKQTEVTVKKNGVQSSRSRRLSSFLISSVALEFYSTPGNGRMLLELQ